MSAAWKLDALLEGVATAPPLPIAGLMAASVALVQHDGPRLAYARAAADSRRAPKLYIGAVMGARPVLPNAEATP